MGDKKRPINGERNWEVAPKVNTEKVTRALEPYNLLGHSQGKPGVILESLAELHSIA